jgi:putative hemolysin
MFRATDENVRAPSFPGRCHASATFIGYEGAMAGTLADSGAMEDVLLPPRFTYASDELGRSGQRVVRLIEWATGQPRIRRMYEHYTKRGRPPELFWHDAIAELRLDLRLNRRPADAIPESGPLMMVANHPFGVVDGIILCWLVAQVRDDYQIMTHRVLHQAPEVRSRILPVDFSGTEAAMLNNLRSRRLARELLDKRGALLVFPGGGVAAAPKTFGRAVDRPWGPLAAKLALTTGAAVLPVYFHGQNSRWFQAASNVHQTLRYALLFHEVRNKIGRSIAVTIGDVIAPERLRAFDDRNAVTQFLRQATHGLADDAGAR